MADDMLAQAHSHLTETLEVASGDIVAALHELGHLGAGDLAIAGSALIRAEKLLTLARAQITNYERFLNAEAIQTGVRANRLLTDLIAGRANG